MASRRRPPFGGKAGFKQTDQGQAVLSTILKQGRKSGQLNLSNRGFTEGTLYWMCQTVLCLKLEVIYQIGFGLWGVVLTYISGLVG